MAIWTCLGAWMVLPAPVSAYLPSGPHVIDLVARYLGRPAALTVDQQVTIFPDPPPETTFLDDGDAQPPAASESDPEETDPTAATPTPPEPVVVFETLHYRFPHSFRSNARTADSERIHLAVGGAVLTMVDGVIRPGKEYVSDWYKDILLYRHPEWMGSRLASIGVDIGTVSLGRVDGTTILIIGARFPDRSRPQVWVDKATYQPLRLIVPQADSDSALEIRYEQWAEKDGIRYPMQVVYQQGGRILRQMRVTRLTSVATLSSGVFDRQPLLDRAKRPPEADTSDTDRRIQQTIDDFGKRYQ